MTRIKSLAHGVKQVANPYESPTPTSKSTYHRVHRSKKNQKYIPKYGKIMLYKHKVKELKEREIEQEAKLALKIMVKYK